MKPETVVAGYYCVNETVIPTECPTGHYCPLNTRFDTEYPCPKGTFNNQTAAYQLDDCIQCSPGHYCHGQGNTVWFFSISHFINF